MPTSKKMIRSKTTLKFCSGLVRSCGGGGGGRRTTHSFSEDRIINNKNNMSQELLILEYLLQDYSIMAYWFTSDSFLLFCAEESLLKSLFYNYITTI